MVLFFPCHSVVNFFPWVTLIDFKVLILLTFSLGRPMKEEESDLGTAVWAKQLNEASRITPQVKKQTNKKPKKQKQHQNILGPCYRKKYPVVNWMLDQ